MHLTSSFSGEGMARLYGVPNGIVVDVGGQDVNGSLKPFFIDAGMRYISVDMVEHPSVDVVVKPGDPLPFATGSVDIVVSTSCFEHDPCFWITFREMARIVKPDGYIYVSAPSNSDNYHGYPGDYWRFHGDAGQALAYWSSRLVDGVSYPTQVEETFRILPEIANKPPGYSEQWVDFVCIWKRVAEPTDKIIDETIKFQAKKLHQYLQYMKGCQIMRC